MALKELDQQVLPLEAHISFLDIDFFDGKLKETTKDPLIQKRD
jgi:hypothetical protein